MKRSRRIRVNCVVSRPLTKAVSSQSGDVEKGSCYVCVGDRVVYPSDTGNEKGTVRWLGVLPGDSSGELIVGVDFDNPIGTGTGKYKGQRLFYAKHGHASLVPLMGLFKDEQQESGGQGSSSGSPQTSPGQTGVQRTSHETAVASGNRPTTRPPGASEYTTQKVLIEPQNESETGSLSHILDLGFLDTKNSARSDIGLGEGSTKMQASDAGAAAVNSGSPGDASAEAMAAAFLPSDRECAVCHEDFNVPKLLPCGHLMCRGCLISWMKKQKETRCPLCQDGILTAPPTPGLQRTEDVADSFYTDHSMMAVVEAARFLDQQHRCKGCVNNAALAVCLTCGDPLCSACKAVHAKLSATSHHSVEDLASLRPQQLAAQAVVHCSVHKNRPADVFCQTHGLPVCLPCAKEHHRRCAEVRFLEEQREDTHHLLSQLEEKLSAAEGRLNHKLAQMNDRLLSVENMKKIGLTFVENQCRRVIEAVGACQNRLQEQVLKKCEDEKRRVGDEGSLQKERCRLTQHRHMLRRVRQVPVVDDARGLQQTVQGCVDSVDQAHLSACPKPADLTFALDENILARLEAALSSLQLL